MSAGPPLRAILSALGRDGRRRLMLLAVLTIIGGLVEFASLLALMRLFRSWLEAGNDRLDSGPLLLFVAAILAANAIRLALLATTQRLVFDTGHRLNVAVQRRVLARAWHTHAAARASGPMAAVELVEQWLYGALMPSLQAGTALVLGAGILAGLLLIDARAALAAAALLGGLFLIVTLLVRRALRRTGQALGQGYEERIATIQDHVGAMRELILAGARGAAAERFRAIDRRLASARASLTIINGVPRILVESIGLVALALVAAWLTGRPGGLTAALPTLAALALGAQRLLPLFQALSQAAGARASMAPLQQRLSELLAGPDLDEAAPPPPLPFEREVRIDGASFHYDGREGPAVWNIDLALRRGERVALTGPNGSGKSTLADLVMGLLLPSEGRVLVDGTPLAPELLRAWHRNVAHVPQAPFLADASIAANIAFMDPTPDHVRVVDAANWSGLHPFIQQLPRGYETRIGERGQMLSGGQRQRLALARALYAPAPLLVLDEATSALDPETEAHVLTALDHLQEQGVTILLIAHRATMLQGCDQVLRMEAGRLVAG